MSYAKIEGKVINAVDRNESNPLKELNFFERLIHGKKLKKLVEELKVSRARTSTHPKVNYRSGGLSTVPAATPGPPPIGNPPGPGGARALPAPPVI